MVAHSSILGSDYGHNWDTNQDEIPEDTLGWEVGKVHLDCNKVGRHVEVGDDFPMEEGDEMTAEVLLGRHLMVDRLEYVVEDAEMEKTVIQTMRAGLET